MSVTTSPLSGVRVLDLSWVGAGPYVTRVLAALGADVIKIESTTRVDPIRLMRPAKDGRIGLNRSGYFANRNADKRSIALNLKSHEGRELMLRLVPSADIVISNFRAGVMERLGLHWTVLKELNTRLIYLEMPMQGASGPHQNYVGYGLTLAALTGIMSLSGHPDRKPVGTGTNYPDHVPNPHHAAGALLCALLEREMTGRGQRIELAQIESTTRLIGPQIVAASAGLVPDRRGNQAVGFAPHNVFPCDNGEEFIAIAIQTDAEWFQVCATLSVPEWSRIDHRYATARGRREHLDELERDLRELLFSSNGKDIESQLMSAGVPAALVRNAEDLLNDAQLISREHWVTLHHPEMLDTLYDSMPYRIASVPIQPRKAAPILGADTADVLKELLQLDVSEVRRLEDRGVLQ